jgi:hypothetical protein
MTATERRDFRPALQARNELLFVGIRSVSRQTDEHFDASVQLCESPPNHQWRNEQQHEEAKPRQSES